MNTFEKYFQFYPNFIGKILSWEPDFLVPVAKKGCKLIKTVEKMPQLQEKPDLIKYRTFFELSNENIAGKKVAIVDDATQYTSTLQEYRRYFENIGAIVRTFSFVGHEDLVSGERWKEDPLAEIDQPLPEPVYQEYILQQSYYLLNVGHHFDLDHLIFELKITESNLEKMRDLLRTQGELLDLEDYFLKNNSRRFTLNQPRFFGSIPFLQAPNLSYGPIQKIKFAYDPDHGLLYFSPIIFPNWKYYKEQIADPLFQRVPFALPYKLPNFLDKKNKGALLRVYYNMYYVCAVSLAKAFIQTINLSDAERSTLKIKRNDLDAVLGVRIADELISSISSFILTYDYCDFSGTVINCKVSKYPKYKSFADVIDALKIGYEKMAAKAKSRVGIHYILSYDNLFKNCSDPIQLSEDLDYFCDFGIIVPEIFTWYGSIMRGCRTGEPKVYYNWERTQLLIPLAIEQFGSEMEKSGKKIKSKRADSSGYRKGNIDPTILNKILANFAYDYPSEIYHELHCLIGEPYRFGTLVKAYHRLHAPFKKDIYQAESISPHYLWDKDIKQFRLKDRLEMIKEVSAAFDERQEVPYSEIISCFKLYINIYQMWKTVDILNMLSICRDENCFYNHVIYNIRKSFEHYGSAIDSIDVTNRKEKFLESLEHSKSADEKLQLAKNIDNVMKKIKNHFGHQVEFIKIVEKLHKNYTSFSAAFRFQLKELERITLLEMILNTLHLLIEENNDMKRVSELQEMQVQRVLKEENITFNNLKDFVNDKKEQQSIYDAIYRLLAIKIDALPREQPMLAERLKNESKKRATNIAINYIFKTQLTQLALLFIDLSGYRGLHDPPEDDLSVFYQIVEKNIENRGGKKLYGGNGGDDMFTVLFPMPQPALSCAIDIKKDVQSNLFLASSNCNVKFGLSFTILKDDQKGSQVIKCWGNAKDCCEYKGSNFRNHSDLLISQDTLEALQGQKETEKICNNFVTVPNETLKNEQVIYKFDSIG